MRSGTTHIALAVAIATIGVAASAAAIGSATLPAGPAKTTIAGTNPSSATAAPAPTTAATPTTASPTTASPTTSGTSTVPAGSDRLVDDTRRIHVTVPSSWTDRETAPQMADDGRDRPKITASPDIAAMNAGWTTPGVWFGVVPGPTDPAAWLRSYAFTTQCSRGPSERFDNGAFTGTKDTWTNCGGGATEIVQVGARTADGSSGVFVQIQVPNPGEPWLAVVLDSIGIVAGAALNPTPQTVNLSTVSTVGPADEALVAAVIPADAVRYVDDTGRIAMSVPAAFVDISTAAGVNNDASLRPALAASPDIDAYYSRWDAAGIEAVVLPAVDPATLLANRDQPCDDGGVRPFSSARFIGLVQTWNGCGGTAARDVQFALMPTDQSVTVLVYAQLPDADNTPLAAALGSLELL